MCANLVANYKKRLTSVIANKVFPPSTKSCSAKGSNTYLTHSNPNQFKTFFKCVLWIFFLLLRTKSFPNI